MNPTGKKLKNNQGICTYQVNTEYFQARLIICRLVTGPPQSQNHKSPRKSINAVDKSTIWRISVKQDVNEFNPISFSNVRVLITRGGPPKPHARVNTPTAQPLMRRNACHVPMVTDRVLFRTHLHMANYNAGKHYFLLTRMA